VPTPFPHFSAYEHGCPLLVEPETAAFGYLRERLHSEQRAARSDLWLSRDLRRIGNGERRSHVLPKPWQALSFLGIATQASIRTRKRTATRNHF